MLGLGFFQGHSDLLPHPCPTTFAWNGLLFWKPMVPGIGFGLGFGGYRRFRSRV